MVKTLDWLAIGQVRFDSNSTRGPVAAVYNRAAQNPRIGFQFSPLCLEAMFKRGVNLEKPSGFLKKEVVPMLLAYGRMTPASNAAMRDPRGLDKIGRLVAELRDGTAALYWWKDAIDTDYGGFTAHPKTDKDKNRWSHNDFIHLTGFFYTHEELEEDGPRDKQGLPAVKMYVLPRDRFASPGYAEMVSARVRKASGLA